MVDFAKLTFPKDGGSTKKGLMKFYINDKEVDVTLLSFNAGLNYGRFNYEGLVIDNYVISLTEMEFIEIVEQEYNRVRDEIKLDDESQNETSEFSVIQYGSVERLISSKQALQDVTISYLDRFLFGDLFPQVESAIYVINSTEMVSAVNGMIEISGRTFRK